MILLYHNKTYIPFNNKKEVIAHIKTLLKNNVIKRYMEDNQVTRAKAINELSNTLFIDVYEDNITYDFQILTITKLLEKYNLVACQLASIFDYEIIHSGEVIVYFYGNVLEHLVPEPVHQNELEFIKWLHKYVAYFQTEEYIEYRKDYLFKRYTKDPTIGLLIPEVKDYEAVTKTDKPIVNKKGRARKSDK